MRLNHNELLTYPNHYDLDLGAAGVGATVYFGSEESDRQLREVGTVFARAHELGMFTVLWCYLRNSAFKKDGVDYAASADLTGQANHPSVTTAATGRWASEGPTTCCTTGSPPTTRST